MTRDRQQVPGIERLEVATCARPEDKAERALVDYLHLRRREWDVLDLASLATRLERIAFERVA